MKILYNLNSVEISKLRILDFYLVFPSEISKIRWREQGEIKKTALQLKNIYHDPVNAFQTFRDMQHLQYAAISTLAAANFIDSVKVNDGIIQRTATSIPDDFLLKHHEKESDVEEIIFKFICNDLAAMSLNGVDGLKHRSGLMEYRYDNV